MTTSTKLAEIASEVGDLERAHDVLIAIVRAKLSGEPNPDAWTRALEIEEASRAADADRSETLRCPDCRKILLLPDVVSTADGKQSVDVTSDPLAYECGPTHMFQYPGFTIAIDDDGAVLHPAPTAERIPFPKDPDAHV